MKAPRQAQEWPYSSHWKLIGKSLSSPGIRSNKKTHIDCSSSVRMAGIMCAYEDRIRRQVRWNNTTMNDPYLTSAPRKIMLSMAGFPTNGIFFHLARAALKTPTNLCKKLFPAIDEWHDELAAKELSLVNNEPIQPTVAVSAFVQVIMMLRKTFIQD